MGKGGASRVPSPRTGRVTRIIRHAVWLHLRFPLSYRDIEDMLAERGMDVSHETVRRWSLKFGLGYARTLITVSSPISLGGWRPTRKPKTGSIYQLVPAGGMRKAAHLREATRKR